MFWTWVGRFLLTLVMMLYSYAMAYSAVNEYGKVTKKEGWGSVGSFVTGTLALLVFLLIVLLFTALQVALMTGGN